MPANRLLLSVNTTGYVTYLRNAPTYIDARVLAASTNETVTIPADATQVIFSANADFYVNPNSGTAAVPAGDVTDGTGSELNPVGYSGLLAGGTFGIISPVAATITMAFYT